MDTRWVRSSRLANVAPLRSYLDALQFAEEVLDKADIANRIVARATEAQAFIDNLRLLISGRFLAGQSYQAVLTDLLGGLLNDSAYFISHTNLGRVIERYGIGPYLDHGDAYFETLSEEPVPTLNRTVTQDFLQRMEGQYVRLGSSVLNTLRNEERFDGFQEWIDDITFAFDDTGDFQRPIYADGEELGGILLTVEAQDPEELFDKYNALRSVFTRQPPRLPITFGSTGKILRNYFAAFPSARENDDEEEWHAPYLHAPLRDGILSRV